MIHKDISPIYPIVLRKLKKTEITVAGVSMIPTLSSGDIITLTVCDTYVPGDILVYQYKNEGLLVHRLLFTEEDSDKATLFHCKGDNAFRLETIPFQNIIGKVIAANGYSISPWPEWMLKLSYAVHLQYKRCEHGAVQARETDIYKLYTMLIHNKFDYTSFSQSQTYDIAKNFCIEFQVSFCELESVLRKIIAKH